MRPDWQEGSVGRTSTENRETKSAAGKWKRKMKQRMRRRVLSPSVLAAASSGEE